MKRLYFSIAALLLMAHAGMGFAHAAEITGTGDATFILPADGSRYTLVSDSHFDSFVINTNSFVFGLNAGSRVTFSSGDRRILVNSLGVATVCGAGKSSVVLGLASGASAQSVTITPGGVCSTGSNASGSSSGGGGGGGGTSGNTTSGSVALSGGHTASTTAPVVKSASGTTSTTVVAMPDIFHALLAIGSRNDEVRLLQDFLIGQGLLAGGNNTGFFGAKTQEAVRQFQKKYGLVASGTPATTGYGLVGKRTRQKLNELYYAGSGGLSEVARQELIKNLQQQILLLQVQILQLQLSQLPKK